MNKWFTRLATKASQLSGSSWAFLSAILLIIIWAASGPIFNFTDTWQLVMNTISSLVTFLMVFLIQNSQNRDTKALHLKLDEIIHVLEPARNELIGAEDMTDEELVRLIGIYRDLSRMEPEECDKDQLLGEALATMQESGS